MRSSPNRAKIALYNVNIASQHRISQAKKTLASSRSTNGSVGATLFGSSATVGFLPPLATATASAYWRTVFAALDADARLLLVARRPADGAIVGTAQLDPAGKENARHRAEVAKVLVLRSARRQGVGRALMEALEEHARRRGRLTLVLDTGADRTVISPAAFARTGLDTGSSRVVSIIGVTGSATAREVTVPLLDVAGARVGPLTVIVHDVGLADIDGLLGRDVLDRFTLTVDSARGRATLVPR